MVLKKNQHLLDAIKLIETVSKNLETITWLWGGLVVDITQGGFLREHDDLDCLTMNLHQLKSQFSGVFKKLRWVTKDLENGDLKLTKDNIKIHLGHIKLSDKVTWTHNGEKGSLIFPVSWLPLEMTEFCGVKTHVALPELQYVLKRHPKLLNPEWKTRDKDILDLIALEKILTKRGIEISTLCAMVTDV